MRLKDQRVVVTGATGIAAASVRMLAAEGASVFVIARQAGQCQSLEAALNAEGLDLGWALADLTEESPTNAAFEAAGQYLGRLDGLLAVAGGSGRRFGDGPAHEVSAAGWAATMEMNGTPTFLAARQALRRMLDQEAGGSIVLVSSVLAEHPAPSLFATHAYAASKGATNALTRTLAAYYAPAAIRVNAIAAGLVDTPMSQRAAEDPETVAYSRRKQPLADGFLEATDVAQAALFLLSDESMRITGQVIDVDGGWGVTEAAK